MSVPAAVVRESSIRLTLRTPLYRAATLALFLSGVGISAAAPLIASFLVTELHASLPVAGLYYLTNLAAPVAGYLVGARSDRTGSRLGLFRICAAAGFLGWIGIAFSTQLWMPFVISAVVLGFAGASTSQLFAALHDELARRPSPLNDGVVAIVRTALTAGWVIGPVIGSFLAASAGYRAMLVVVAIATLAQILPLGGIRDGRPRTVPQSDVAAPETGPIVLGGASTEAALPEGTATAAAAGGAEAASAEAEHRQGPGLRAMLPLLFFTALYICVYAGESVKYAYLPIYMNEQMQLSPALVGAVIGIQPLVELPLIPVAVMLGRRFGAVRLMAIGAAMGVAANLCFALIGTVPALFAGQILMGIVWGIFAGLGILVAQRLLPTAVATASAIFLSSTALSSALGGLTGGFGVAALGLPMVFVIPAGFAAIAVIGLIVMDRRGRQADQRRTQMDQRRTQAV
ncbi:MFS transporter [Mycetocola sp. JXN-3]|uniref:MFS transporter n=1 Tax=Mycetocola sp. JXN-3 TaxID=2116510 RepID=UPI00165D2A16|nr:MFS transporter [Mycetocola sp. JXN-3]